MDQIPSQPSNVRSLQVARNKKQVLVNKAGTNVEQRLADLEKDMLNAVEMTITLQNEVEYLNRIITKLLNLMPKQGKTASS